MEICTHIKGMDLEKVGKCAALLLINSSYPPYLKNIHEMLQNQ